MYRWRDDDREKFDDRIRKTEDHWIWVGHVNARDGYGRFKPRHNERSELAHRLAYERWIGPVPDEAPVIDHIGHPFNLRRCVRPDHLEAITHEENTRRGNSPAGVNARKTHCSGCGLALEGDNLKITPQGWRVCLNCRRARHREAKERAKARASGRSAAPARALPSPSPS